MEKLGDLTKFTNPVGNRASQSRALWLQSSHCKQCDILIEAEPIRCEKSRGSKPGSHSSCTGTNLEPGSKSGRFRCCMLPPSAPMGEVQQRQGYLQSLIMAPIHSPLSPKAAVCQFQNSHPSVCTVMCLTASQPSNPTGPT